MRLSIKLCCVVALLAPIYMIGACGDDAADSEPVSDGSGDSGTSHDASSNTSDTSVVLGDGQPPPNGGGVFVQQKAASKPDALTFDVVLPNAPANGNALVLAVAASIDHPTTISGGGVSWTQQASSGTQVMTSVWAGFGVSNGTTTVTLTYDRLQSFVAVLVTEWSGLAALGTKSATSGSTIAINPTQIDTAGARIVFATVGIEHIDPTTGPTGGNFTQLESAALGNRQLLSGWALGAAATAPTWTSSKSGGWDALLVSFQAP